MNHEIRMIRKIGRKLLERVVHFAGRRHAEAEGHARHRLVHGAGRHPHRGGRECRDDELIFAVRRVNIAVARQHGHRVQGRRVHQVQIDRKGLGVERVLSKVEIGLECGVETLRITDRPSGQTAAARL